MPSNNYIYKMSNAGGMSTITRYVDMLAGNATFEPWAPSGAYDSIATTTVGAGGASTVTFSSIPSTYTHLQLRVIARCAFTGTVRNITSQINGDTASNYNRHYFMGNGSTVIAGYDAASVMFLGSSTGTGNGVSRFAVNVYDYLDYANTNKFKTVRALFGFEDNIDGQMLFGSGLWRNTSAISSITFSTEGNYAFNEYTQFALYGIKGN